MELSKLNTSDNSTGKLTPQSIQNGINTTAQAQTLLGAQGTHKDTDTVTSIIPPPACSRNMCRSLSCCVINEIHTQPTCLEGDWRRDYARLASPLYIGPSSIAIIYCSIIIATPPALWVGKEIIWIYKLSNGIHSLHTCMTVYS